MTISLTEWSAYLTTNHEVEGSILGTSIILNVDYFGTRSTQLREDNSELLIISKQYAFNRVTMGPETFKNGNKTRVCCFRDSDAFPSPQRRSGYLGMLHAKTFINKYLLCLRLVLIRGKAKVIILTRSR